MRNDFFLWVAVIAFQGFSLLGDKGFSTGVENMEGIQQKKTWKASKKMKNILLISSWLKIINVFVLASVLLRY